MALPFGIHVYMYSYLTFASFHKRKSSAYVVVTGESTLNGTDSHVFTSLHASQFRSSF